MQHDGAPSWFPDFSRKDETLLREFHQMYTYIIRLHQKGTPIKKYKKILTILIF